MRKIAILFGIVFLLVSCEKETVTELTNPETETNQSSLKGVKPDTPSDNAVVVRYEDYRWWGLYDAKRDLSAYIGVDIYEFCYGNPAECLDIHNIQDINLDELDESLRTIRLINGEASVSVFEGYVPVANVCDFEPLWIGTAHLIVTDNDLVPDGPNFNSWGLTVIGDGLSINFRAVWNADVDNYFSPVAFIDIRVK